MSSLQIRTLPSASTVFSSLVFLRYASSIESLRIFARAMGSSRIENLILAIGLETKMNVGIREGMR